METIEHEENPQHYDSRRSGRALLRNRSDGVPGAGRTDYMHSGSMLAGSGLSHGLLPGMGPGQSEVPQ